MTYHDLYVTTDTMERTQFSRLPFNLFLTCTRTAGWELWDSGPNGEIATAKLVAGEYDTKGLRLDVGGHTIVDSIKEPIEI
jgi:hypothetical protein